MASDAARDYDELPFLGDTVPHAHSEFMETVARVHGMQPAPAGRARVLELGCGVGENLLPMAERNPEATFLGIDLSRRQIAMAADRARECSFDNVTFQVGDILELDPDLGEFDYIITHGVYSWVEPPVRERLMAACRDYLAPQGIVYVGYKTYPGWHLYDAIRAMMLYACQGATALGERVARSRSVVRLLQASPMEKDPNSAALQAALAKLAEASDDYLVHEYLVPINHPVYFHEFIAHAKSHGLQYLGDGALGIRWADRLTPEFEQRVAEISPDPVVQEQYRDIVRNRPFRQTLLCHENIDLSRSITPESLRGLYLEGAYRPENADLDLCANDVAWFVHRCGGRISTAQGLLKAALLHLGEAWPEFVRYENLIALASRRLKTAGAVPVGPLDVQQLEQSLLEGCAQLVIQVHSRAASFVAKPGAAPVASPLARAQARRRNQVSNRRHESVILNPLDRWLLASLDGRFTESQLIERAAAAVAAGRLSVAVPGREVRTHDEAIRFFGPETPAALVRLTESALLIA